MIEIALIEDACCHPGELDDLVAFLERRFVGRAKVTKYSVGGQFGFSAVPVQLGEQLGEQGACGIPLVAVGGYLVLQGALPDHHTVAEAIEARIVAIASPAGVTAA